MNEYKKNICKRIFKKYFVLPIRGLGRVKTPEFRTWGTRTIYSQRERGDTPGRPTFIYVFICQPLR